MISTWVLIISLNGTSPSWPYQTLMINDMPTQQECQRVSKEIIERFRVQQGLCVEVRKVKP